MPPEIPCSLADHDTSLLYADEETVMVACPHPRPIVTVRFSKTLNELPKPTVAVIHGACFGGGVGIACCVDVALAMSDALFAISEVRHGIAPAPISTHMVNAIGLRQTRRYALTGERFGAEEAARIGLVHEVVAANRMEARLEEVLEAIVLGEREVELLAHEGWMQRQSTEGQEGTTAFREKRRPGWYVSGDTHLYRGAGEVAPRKRRG